MVQNSSFAFDGGAAAVRKFMSDRGEEQWTDSVVASFRGAEFEPTNWLAELEQMRSEGGLAEFLEVVKMNKDKPKVVKTTSQPLDGKPAKRWSCGDWVVVDVTGDGRPTMAIIAGRSESGDSSELSVRLLETAAGVAYISEGDQDPSRLKLGAARDMCVSECNMRKKWYAGQRVDIDTEDGMEFNARILGPPAQGKVLEEMRVHFADGTVDDWPVDSFVKRSRASESGSPRATSPTGVPMQDESAVDVSEADNHESAATPKDLSRGELGAVLDDLLAASDEDDDKDGVVTQAGTSKERLERQPEMNRNEAEGDGDVTTDAAAAAATGNAANYDASQPSVEEGTPPPPPGPRRNEVAAEQMETAILFAEGIPSSAKAERLAKRVAELEAQLEVERSHKHTNLQVRQPATLHTYM